jgi:hypothetical protein
VVIFPILEPLAGRPLIVPHWTGKGTHFLGVFLDTIPQAPYSADSWISLYRSLHRLG